MEQVEMKTWPFRVLVWNKTLTNKLRTIRENAHF